MAVIIKRDETNNHLQVGNMCSLSHYVHGFVNDITENDISMEITFWIGHLMVILTDEEFDLYKKCVEAYPDPPSDEPSDVSEFVVARTFTETYLRKRIHDDIESFLRK